MVHDHLLPHNATDLEKDLSSTLGRVSNIPLNITDISKIETCPENILPWMAWAFSVDYWSPDFTKDQKIKAIKDSFEIHRTKGTLGAVKRALDNLGIRFDIEEWFEYGGAPYTFRVNAYADITGENTAISQEIAHKITDVVKNTKNLRSHETIRVGALMEQKIQNIPHTRLSQICALTAEAFNGITAHQNMMAVSHIRTSQIIHFSMEAR